MTVAECMSRPARTCSADDVLRTAAESMWDGDCGCVVVTDEEKHPIAMVTDRDVCMAALRGESLMVCQVRRVMSGDVLTCEPKTDVREAAAMMADGQVRRLPVVDGENRVIGVVSLNDLALAATPTTRGNGKVSAQEVAMTLAAICRHRPSPASSAP